MRRLIIAAALGVALAGCGAATAAPAAPPAVTTPMPTTTIPGASAVSYDCDPGITGPYPPPPQPVYTYPSINGGTSCLLNCDPPGSVTGASLP